MVYNSVVRRYVPLFVAGLAFAMVSCSTEKKVTLVEAPVFVGTVDNVYERQGYVLIRVNGVMPEEGAVLISQSSGGADDGSRSANLVVSAERLGNLRVPADVRSGHVLKGDYVYLYKDMAPPAALAKHDENPLPPVDSLDDQSPIPPVPQSVSGEGASGGGAQDIEEMLKNIPDTYEKLIY